MLFGELLTHIWNKATCVSQGIPLFHVVADQICVALDLLRGSQVRRRENVTVMLDLYSLARTNPLAGSIESKLIHAIIQGDERCCARTIEHHKAHDLITA